MGLKVEEANIDDILKNLKSGKWQVPEFQREFVWTDSQIISLIDSIFRARPIGMCTLWEQSDKSELPLEPISIRDYDYDQGKTGQRFYAIKGQQPSSYFAILDGRQRCTSIAMVFGGLSAKHGSYKYSGKFFLNVAEKDSTKQIEFIDSKSIDQRNLNTPSVCIANGLFPLALDEDQDGMLGQWMGYIQEIRNPDNYPNGELPEKDELERRNSILKQAFDGINNTKLAVYIVPNSYNLDDICEIFETLNTSGTKVSTVDLLHSFLYADTQDDDPILLRDWLYEMSELDGTIGWVSRDRRPELTAQVVTACYMCLDEKTPPRNRTNNKKDEIKTIKSSSLLATPADHWRHIIENSETLANFFTEFQYLTAGGHYEYRSCPYPVLIGIYVSIRWLMEFGKEETKWSKEDLDALFSAFFWRSSMTKRYDQGVLTQFTVDQSNLLELLKERHIFDSSSAWAKFCNKKLDQMIEDILPTEDILVEYLTSGRVSGAIKKAFVLPMRGRVNKDLLDPDEKIGFPDKNVDLHHIYPRSWCKNNASGDLAELLDEEIAEKNYRESIANLMPISRTSNKFWRAKVPGQALREKDIRYQVHSDIFDKSFIDEDAYKYLVANKPDPESFWYHRAHQMAKFAIKKFSVTV